MSDAIRWRPDGYTQMAPYLIVSGADALLSFLETVFGAEPLRRYEDGEGGIIHAEARIGDTVLMVADAVEGWPPVVAHVHVYVPDADTVYEAALAAGAESLQTPVRREGDPDRRGGFRDPSGTTWWVATQEDDGEDGGGAS
jgi:PhnB protein